MLSNQKWFTWLMLFIATPYGIYLLFKNRKDYPTFIPYVVGGIFGLVFINIFLVENGLFTLLGYLSALLLVASVVALFKGEVTSLHLQSRKVAAITLILSFIGIGVFGAALPDVEDTTEGPNVEVHEDEDDFVSDVENEEKAELEQEKAREPAAEEPKKEPEDESTIDSDEELDIQEENEITEEVTPPKSYGDMSVHFVNVGQGSAQVIVSPSGKVLLIDAGNNDDEDDIVAYLNRLGVKRIDYVVGTHPDADHIGGLDAAIDSFAIGEIFMPKISANTDTYADVLQSIKDKGLKVKTGVEGINLSLGDGIKAEFLAPIGSSSERNEMSIVVKLTYGEASFLFTGDTDEQSERDGY